MALFQVGLFPLLSVAFALLAFFIGYAIAIKNDHVDAWLPFISDCGCLPPESNIFGQLLNVSCFFLAITVYLVHRNTTVYYEKIEKINMGAWKIFSFLLMFLGWFATFGASMVANFQEGTQLATHDTGAFMFFIGIMIYFWGQVIMGFFCRPRLVPIQLTIFRLIINICITALLIFHMVCLFAQPLVKNGKDGKKPADIKWPGNIERPKPGTPFYDNHIATTLSEWIMALLIELFVLTYTYDFAFTVLHAPTVAPDLHRDHDIDIPSENASKIYYAHQVSPMLPLDTANRSLDMVDTMSHRRLPRIDLGYGTYSEPAVARYAASVGPRPHSRSQVATATYSQYQYY